MSEPTVYSFEIERGERKTLSRDCDGCSQLKACNRRYGKVVKGGKVYCPDGSAHLVDEASLVQVIGLVEQRMELLQ